MGSSNRFDTSEQQQYVSTRVPMPFEAIGALGAKMQQKYDTAIGDTYKLNDLMANVPAIHDPQLGLSNIQKKQELDAKYHPRIDALAAKIAAGDPNANRELEQVKRDFTNDPDRQELENSYLNYKAYKEDKTKKAGKYDSLLDDYQGQQLIGETGELKPFRYSGMEDSLDIEKRFSEAMDKIKEDTKGWGVEHIGADGIKIGNKGTQSGITKDKVMGVARQKVAVMLSQTPEGQQFKKKLRKLNPGISEEQLLNEGVKALFSAGSEQVGMEKTSANTVDPTMIWSAQHQDAKEKLVRDKALVGQPLEGNTLDLTKDNKEYQKLKESGDIETNQDGTIKVNWLNLKNEKPMYYDAQGNRTRNSVDSEGIQNKAIVTNTSEKTKNLVKVVKDIADQINYKGELKAANYDDIISKYNAYSKVRLYDEQMAAPVSEIESKKAQTNWSNYDIMDINSPDKLAGERISIGKNDKLILNTWKNSPEGKMNRGGVIVSYDSDGNATETPVLIRPKGIVDDNYHNSISKLGLIGAKYEVGDVKPIKSENGIDVLPIDGKSKIRLPNVGIIEAIGYYDDVIKSKKSAYLITPEDGSKPLSFPTHAGLQQYLNFKYYGTDVGSSETYNIAPGKQKFEATQESQ